MTELERITDQVHRSFVGPAWHGPSFMESLNGVDATLANRRPIEAGHTIWEFVLHISITIDVVLGRMEGKMGALSDDMFWSSPASTDEASWQNLLAELPKKHETLVAAIRAFDAAKLDEPLFSSGSSAVNNFLGHAQHNAYHAGQIAILKKM